MCNSRGDSACGVPGSITFLHRWQIRVFWGSDVAFIGSRPGA